MLNQMINEILNIILDSLIILVIFYSPVFIGELLDLFKKIIKRKKSINKVILKRKLKLINQDA